MQFAVTCPPEPDDSWRRVKADPDFGNSTARICIVHPGLGNKVHRFNTTIRYLQAAAVQYRGPSRISPLHKDPDRPCDIHVNGPTEGLYSIIKKFKGRCRVRELRPLSNQDPCPVVIEPSETGRYALIYLMIEFEPSAGPFDAPVVCQLRIGPRHCFNIRPSLLTSGTAEARQSSMSQSIRH